MKLNKRIVIVMTTVLALFLIIVIYLTYFTIFEAPNLKKSTYNPRIWEKEDSVLRGEIYDRNGTVLAYSEKDGSKQTRVYPYGELYAHTIGYNCRKYGKTNIEIEFNDILLQSKTSFKVKRETENGVAKLEEGADLYLTLDHGMTEYAAQLLGNNKGSVVAMNPKTGEVYCLYSNPSFDPNESVLDANWNLLINSEDSPFMARSTQGLYAPGSTFKIVTATSAIDAGHGGFTMDDKGSTKVDGRPFENYGGNSYGNNLDMKKAITKSSNVYFVEISQKVGKDNLGETAHNLFVTQKVPFDIDVKAREAGFKDFNNTELAEAAIGQGTLQVTPFNMAIAACAIANDGVIMKPYMVAKSSYDNGEIVKQFSTEPLSKNATSWQTAKTVREYMESCVTSGTGKGARVSGISVAGKTGTAENERKGASHAWFVGIAPADNPQIVVCVMQEYAGKTGGTVSAPIAGKIINYALKNGLITK